MKKNLFLFLVVIYSHFLFSQNHSTCQTAIPFCLDSTHVYQLNTTDSVQPCPGGGYNCYACLSSNHYPKWFWMKIKTSGYLGVSTYSVNNLYFDYVCWGPFFTLTNICDSLTFSRARCCGGTFNLVHNAYFNNVDSGKYYIWCIVNQSNQPNGIYFQQYYSGTLLTDCNITGINNKQLNSLEEKSELFQNTPNPFKTLTTFSYTLDKNGFVELEIRDKYGREVNKIVNKKQMPGFYSIDWDSANIPAGMYYYLLRINGNLIAKKAIKINEQ